MHNEEFVQSWGNEGADSLRQGPRRLGRSSRKGSRFSSLEEQPPGFVHLGFACSWTGCIRISLRLESDEQPRGRQKLTVLPFPLDNLSLSTSLRGTVPSHYSWCTCVGSARSRPVHTRRARGATGDGLPLRAARTAMVLSWLHARNRALQSWIRRNVMILSRRSLAQAPPRHVLKSRWNQTHLCS
jgi:hypothetical protein